MFGFFTWLRNRRIKRDSERRRLLFKYFDGTKERRIDPMRAWREIANDKEFNPSTMLALADAQQEPEASITMRAVCRVFDVKRFDDATGLGLTDAELMNVLDDFYRYLETLQKKTSNGQTLPSPTEPPPSSDSPAGPSGPTKPLSASGSTSNGPKPATPTAPYAPPEPSGAERL